MKNLFAIICFLFIFSCEKKVSKNSKKIQISEIAKKAKDSSQLFDTVVFDKDMQGEELQNKIKFDKSRFSFYQKIY